MPIARVQMPDGRIARFEVPDGTTPEQISAMLAGKVGARAGMEHQYTASQGMVPSDPTAGMSGTEKFLAGAGKTYYDIARGAGGVLGMVSPADVAEARRLDEPLMNTPEAKAGNVTGHLALTMPFAFARGANTVLGAGTYGGMYGMLQPAESATERFGNAFLGSAGSGLGVGAVRSLPFVKKALIDPFTKSGVNRLTRDAIRSFEPDAANLVASAEASRLPGVQRTLAEATRSPAIAQLQRASMAASQDSAGRLAERAVANDQAIVDALRRFGGTERDRDLQKGLRTLMTETLYKEAADGGVDQKMAAALKPQIDSLLSRPSVQTALGKVKDLFGEEGVAMTKSGSVKGMQYLKQSLDDMIERAGAPGSSIGKNQLHALNQTRADLISVLDDVVPKQRAADVAYAQWSRPVNEMEVVNALANKLEPALTRAGGVGLTPSAYARALDDITPTIKQATGRTVPVEQVLSTPARNTLDAVADDLGRRQFAQKAGSMPNSNTAQYLTGANVLRSALGPLGLPSGFADSTIANVLSNRWVSAAMRPAETRVQESLARALLDPGYAKMVLSSPTGSAMLAEALSKRVLPPIAIGGLPNLLQQ